MTVEFLWDFPSGICEVEDLSPMESLDESREDAKRADYTAQLAVAHGQV